MTSRIQSQHASYARRASFALLLALTLALGGCGGDSSVGSSTSPGDSSPANPNPGEKPKPTDQSLAGVAQKGPYRPSSKVTATRLKDSGKLGKQSKWVTTASNGRFSIKNIGWQGVTLLQAKGQFFNENTGDWSTQSATLNAIVKLPVDGHANINLFTNFVAARTRALLGQGQSFAKALQNARDDLQAVFGIKPSATKLNVLKSGEHAKANASLLAFSAAVLKAAATQPTAPKRLAVQRAARKTSAATGVEELVHSMTTDFADDGHINSKGQKALSNTQKARVENPALTKKASDNLDKNSMFDGNPPKDFIDNLPKWAQPIATKAEVIGALKRAMRARGYLPPTNSGLQLSDYIVPDVNMLPPKLAKKAGITPQPTRSPYLNIGPEGHLIPDGQWKDTHPDDYCKKRARFIKPAKQMFAFNIYTISRLGTLPNFEGKVYRDQIGVFSQVIDVGTGIIQSQARGERTRVIDAVTGKNLLHPNAYFKALNEAWGNLSPAIGKPVGPCGDVRVKHLSGDRVGEKIVVRAGWPDSNKNLDYVWNWGDGVTQETSTRKASHIYSKEGTYTITVRAVQPDGDYGKGTIKITIGGGLTLHFSSTVRAHASGHGFSYTVDAKYESSIPLALTQNEKAYKGTGALSYVSCSYSSSNGLAPPNTCQADDGHMRASDIPASLGGSPATIHLYMTDEPKHTGLGWFVVFVPLHEKFFTGQGLEFTLSGQSGNGSVVASKVLHPHRVVKKSGMKIVYDGTTIIEIRQQ